jgi:outer membrane protein TolC
MKGRIVSSLHGRIVSSSHRLIVLLGALSSVPLAAQQAGARPISLEDAIGLAVPASETLDLARAGVYRARGEQYRQGWERYPQLSGTLGFSRLLKSQFEGFSFGGDSTGGGAPDDSDTNALPFGQKNTYNLGLNLTWSLFTGGRISGQRQFAEAGRRSADLGYTSAQAQVTLEVVQAYYDAAAADLQVRIAEIALEQSDTTLRQTEQRRAAGTQPEFDLLRARVARDNSRTIVIARRVDRDVSYMSLRRLLGIPLGQPITLTTSIADTALAGVPTLAALLSVPPDTVVANRIVVRQAADAVDGQEGLWKASKSQVWPQLQLTSQYGRVGYPANIDPFAPKYYTNWNFGFGLSFPIVTGGRIKGDKVVAEAGVREAKSRLQQVTELAEVDTRSALAQLEAAQAAWASSEGTVQQAQRAYEIADLRFREGLSTQTELLDARAAQATAQSIRLEAARSLGVARVRVALLPALPVAGVPSNVGQQQQQQQRVQQRALPAQNASGIPGTTP